MNRPDTESLPLLGVIHQEFIPNSLPSVILVDKEPDEEEVRNEVQAVEQLAFYEGKIGDDVREPEED
jgi:hypothetical protein